MRGFVRLVMFARVCVYVDFIPSCAVDAILKTSVQRWRGSKGGVGLAGGTVVPPEGFEISKTRSILQR